MCGLLFSFILPYMRRYNKIHHGKHINFEISFYKGINKENKVNKYTINEQI